MAVAAVPVWAATQDISLTFGSLPSAQGWTYTTSGSHAGTLEGLVFETDGAALHLQTLGRGYGVSDGSILYQISGIVTAAETKQLRVTAQAVSVEGSGSGAQGQGGNAFGFTTGATQYGFSITPTAMYVLTRTGFTQVGGTVNNLQPHDYVFDYVSPSTTRLYRDGVLIHTNTQGFAVAANRVFFGDGTGGANSHTIINQLRFIQDVESPAIETSWGRIKSLYK
jgi:hypothetical protein